MSMCKNINQKNNELDKKLSNENKAIVIDMTAYLRLAPISDLQVEEIRQDILDMALSAQDRNEPLSKVFGDDGKAFCDEIIANVRHTNPISRIIQWIAVICGVFSVFGIIDLVFSGYPIKLIHSLQNHSKINLSYPITWGFIINSTLIAIISFGIVFLICKNAFTAKKFAKKFDSQSKPKKFIIGCLFGAILLGYLFSIAKLNGIVLTSVNIIVYCASIFILFIAYKMFSRI